MKVLDLIMEAQPLPFVANKDKGKAEGADVEWAFSTDTQNFSLRAYVLNRGKGNVYKRSKGATVFSLFATDGNGRLKRKMEKLTKPLNVISTIAEVISTEMIANKMSDVTIVRVPDKMNIEAATRIMSRYIKLKAPVFEVLGAVNGPENSVYIVACRKGKDPEMSSIFGDGDIKIREFVEAGDDEAVQEALKKTNAIIRRLMIKQTMSADETAAAPDFPPYVAPAVTWDTYDHAAGMLANFRQGFTKMIIGENGYTPAFEGFDGTGYNPILTERINKYFNPDNPSLFPGDTIALQHETSQITKMRNVITQSLMIIAVYVDYVEQGWFDRITTNDFHAVQRALNDEITGQLVKENFFADLQHKYPINFSKLLASYRRRYASGLLRCVADGRVDQVLGLDFTTMLLSMPESSTISDFISESLRYSYELMETFIKNAPTDVVSALFVKYSKEVVQAILVLVYNVTEFLSSDLCKLLKSKLIAIPAIKEQLENSLNELIDFESLVTGPYASRLFGAPLTDVGRIKEAIPSLNIKVEVVKNYFEKILKLDDQSFVDEFKVALNNSFMDVINLQVYDCKHAYLQCILRMNSISTAWDGPRSLLVRDNIPVALANIAGKNSTSTNDAILALDGMLGQQVERFKHSFVLHSQANAFDAMSEVEQKIHALLESNIYSAYVYSITDADKVFEHLDSLVGEDFVSFVTNYNGNASINVWKLFEPIRRNTPSENAKLLVNVITRIVDVVDPANEDRVYTKICEQLRHTLRAAVFDDATAIELLKANKRAGGKLFGDMLFDGVSAKQKQAMSNDLAAIAYSAYNNGHPELMDYMYDNGATPVKRALDTNMAVAEIIGKHLSTSLDKNSIIPTYSRTEMTVQDHIKMIGFNGINIKDIATISGIKKTSKMPISEYIKACNTAMESPDVIPDPKVAKVDMSTDDMYMAMTRFMSMHAGKHGDIYPNIINVFNCEVGNKAAFDKFFESKSAAGYSGKVVPAIHGCGGIAANMILRYGYVVIPSDAAGVVGRMLGDGIYFTTKVDKASQYVSNEGYSREHGERGYIFELDTNLGKPKTDYASAGVPGDPARQAGSIVSPEWCVRNPEKQTYIYKVYEVELIGKEAITKRLEELKPKKESTEISSFGEMLAESYNIPKADPVIEIKFLTDEIPIYKNGLFYLVEAEDLVLAEGAEVEVSPAYTTLRFPARETEYWTFAQGKHIDGDRLTRYNKLVDKYIKSF